MSMLSLDDLPVPIIAHRLKKRSRAAHVVKLALQRENAKRLLLRLSNPVNPSPSKHKFRRNSNSRPSSSRSNDASSVQSTAPRNEEMRVNDESGGRQSHADVLRERLHHQNSGSRRSSVASVQSCSTSEAPTLLPTLANEKILASGNGITVSVAQAEPVIFLEGFEMRDESKTSMLRGHVHVKITKSTKIKKIYLTFKGGVTSSWPEGVPNKKGQYYDNWSLMTHTWPFFNAQFESAENGYGADIVQITRGPGSKETLSNSTIDILAKSGSTTTVNYIPKEARRLSLQHTTSRSFVKGESSNGGQTVAQKGYKVFRPGDYIYNFELPIDSHLPETIKTDYASVKYWLDVSVERAGVFRPNLLGTKEVLFVRTPSQSSLEQVEPIAISRTWEDQLHYDIVISGKAFPLGSKIPIAFKLTPLAKVACHRIKVYVTESIQQWTTGKTAHRLSSSRQLLLFEKRADAASVSTYPGSSMRVTAGGGIEWDDRAAAAEGQEIVNPQTTSLLGDLEGDFNAGPTEMEFDVQLPTCPLMKDKDPSQRLHCDTAFENIEINHWIKIVLRLSKPDENFPRKRRHFEISIDSPFHILSCLATQSNIYLPSYSSPSSFPSEEYECGCPGAQPSSRSPSRSASSGLGDLSMLLNLSNDPSPPLPQRSFSTNSGGIARPAEAHIASHNNNSSSSDNNSNNYSSPNNVARPIHLIRLPSFAPPAFDDLPPPPPLMTPPPEYAAVIPTDDPSGGLMDYFERLRHAEQEYDENTRGSARVDVPLTPGGRVHRSIEIPRELVRVDALGE
ncbi:hypothetical protein PRK78_007182 [Emydomyces testavorans]|uniref:Arrestin C-terminal-like domain-containing protein n=1 Tax=Emydomyces testavorans TaxID=2070801 RepID=A0AAF0IL80_9EURO|nr:hypothetical protein PRK78_007182 [Emydomyces testavorans]